MLTGRLENLEQEWMKIVLNNSGCKNALLLVMLRWGVKIGKRFENNFQFRCRELPPKTPNLVVVLRVLMVAGSTFHPFI